ncbi:MAG: sugar transferase [Microbacterium sp.]|nr:MULTISPECIES: sugar transferase [unclassified Microbacterium]MBN9215729.1 sugar transferase [Microbacterium sp.]
MPLLEQRLTLVRRHRVAGTAIDTLLISVAAAVTATTQLATLPTPPGDPAALPAAVVLVACWSVALMAFSERARRRGAGGRMDLMPILHSAVIGVAALAVAAGLFAWTSLRPHIAITVPLGIATLVAARLIHRGWALRHPARQTLAPRTLVVGSRSGVEHTIRSLVADPRFAHHIVGAAFPGAADASLSVDDRAFRALGSPAQVAALARSECIETVIIADGIDDPDYLRRLSWSLEGAATDLILATRLADVDRSRIAFEATHGLALTHVSLPKFDRSTLRTKRALDVVVAALALVPIAVITPLIALAIKLDSPGSVLFRQRRIGRDGREFDILKFRTMGMDAEAKRAELEAANEGSGPLFKLKADPRITRVGGFLRRFSLDELPQFWNVLAGEMSVVGPRPPLPSEVADYEHDALRRLYVQPGITGLWQISGRSDLTWEQSIRLDLHYVENWSLATDLKIIGRTAAAMVRPRGAY